MILVGQYLIMGNFDGHCSHLSLVNCSRQGHPLPVKHQTPITRLPPRGWARITRPFVPAGSPRRALPPEESIANCESHNGERPPPPSVVVSVASFFNLSLIHISEPTRLGM